MTDNTAQLHAIAKKVMTPGKGILASDERAGSANKNLVKAGITLPESEAEQAELRRRYRELFINTPDLNEYINGMIICDETFWQNDSKGIPFREILQEKDILIVIKVDEGTIDMPGFPGEKITLGLDGLRARLIKYYENGARLAKWRSVIKIGDGIPTDECIEANVLGLAEYADFCQQAGIVPIVEPEVLIDGNHTIEQAEEVTTRMLSVLFERLMRYRVDLEGLILKSSMVLPGKDSKQEVSSEQIAEATVRTFMNSVPPAVPGIVFLSGGQSALEATQNLDSIADLEPLPWQITFSYLRAIEGSAAEVWGGKDENIKDARKEFVNRLKMSTLAEKGKYNAKKDPLAKK